MNDSLKNVANGAGGACEDYECDVGELVDGTLAPEKARVVSLHLAGCARCRRWRDEYAAMDARLTRALPVPRLAADFEWKLAARVSARTQIERADTRAAAEQEYCHLMAGLRWGLRGATLGSIAGAVAALGCVLAVLPGLIDRFRPFVGTLEGPAQNLIIAGITAGITAAALGWSFRNGVLPGLQLRR